MKNVFAWLRVIDVSGEFPGPTSEDTYLANLGLIDGVHPVNGGRLQADGIWLQEEWKFDGPWPQSIPEIARANGHLYMPAVDCDRSGILKVLDDPTIQETAADDLVALMGSKRFDSPWDGVCLDLEGVPSAYKSQLSDFLYLLSYKIRAAGFLLAVWTRGKVSDPGPDYDPAYSYDFSVVGQTADIVHLGCYGYWQPRNSWQQASISPYWWIAESVQYALEQGIPAQRMVLNLANYSKYWPNSNEPGGRMDVTHAWAMQKIAEEKTSLEWIERNEHGLIRERFADLGPAHLWIRTGDTLRHGLDLIDDHDLSGYAQFVLGYGDDYEWQIINEWKSG